MWSLLLNPKNAALIGLCVVCLILGGVLGFKQIQIGKLENAISGKQNELDACSGQLDLLRGEVTSLNKVISDQVLNVEVLKTQVMELQEANAKTVVVRKKIRELVYVPTGKACETSDQLGDEYARVAADITARIVGVRGKVSPSGSHNGGTAPQILYTSTQAGFSTQAAYRSRLVE